MSGVIEVSIDLPPEVGVPVETPLKIEALSAPPGGDILVQYDTADSLLKLMMSSDDLSTLRAMLNSYLGLVSTAVKTAWK